MRSFPGWVALALVGAAVVTLFLLRLPFEIAFLLMLAATAAAMLAVAQRRPARVAMVLAVVGVATGVVWTTARVVDGLDEQRIEYHGKLDAEEILATHHPDALRAPNGDFTANERSAYLERAEGTATQPDATGGQLALWGVAELAPWVLGAILLTLLWPMLRAADRGDPFAVDVARRLRLVGSLLLVGLPALGLVQFVLGESVSTGVAPFVEPTWTVSVYQLLPGVLVLVLGEVFRHGAALRDLERHTV